MIEFVDSLGVVLMGEEKRRLDVYLAFDGDLSFLGVDGFGGGLRIEGSAFALGGTDHVKIVLPGVGSFVELVYHILIKLLRSYYQPPLHHSTYILS